MWSNLNQRERIMLILLAIIVSTVIYYYYMYQPMQSELTRLQQESQQKEKQLKMDLLIVKKLPEIRQRYDKLKGIEKMELKFSSLTPEDFLELINRISQESEVNLTTYIPEDEAESTRLHITIIGNYNQLNTFLEGLKKLANQLEVNTLTVKPQKDNHLQMNMVLNYKKRAPFGGEGS